MVLLPVSALKVSSLLDGASNVVCNHWYIQILYTCISMFVTDIMNSWFVSSSHSFHSLLSPGFNQLSEFSALLDRWLDRRVPYISSIIQLIFFHFFYKYYYSPIWKYLSPNPGDIRQYESLQYYPWWLNLYLMIYACCSYSSLIMAIRWSGLFVIN